MTSIQTYLSVLDIQETALLSDRNQRRSAKRSGSLSPFVSPSAIRPGEIRDPKPAAVFAGRDAGEAFEKPTEKCGFLVADRPADLVDRQSGSLQAALRFLDAQALDIRDRGHGRRPAEAALERSVRQARLPDERFDRCRQRVVVLEPV